MSTIKNVVLATVLFYIFCVAAQRPPFCEGLLDPRMALCQGLTRDTCSTHASCYWRDTTNENRLYAHNAQFTEAVDEAAAGAGLRVLVARGFGLANTVIVEGPTCFVVVDTSESVQVAQRIRQAVAPQIRDKRLCAVIYTHSHVDHILGTAAWSPRNASIWAHANFRTNLMLENLASYASHTTSMRQYGTHLDENADGLVNAGIGRRLEMDANATRGYVRPSHTYLGQHSLCFEPRFCATLIASPGENADQTSIWLPSIATLISADAYYHAFPNLYTIRRAAPRSPRDWWHTLDVFRRLNASVLVPMHTRHISGTERVDRALEHFRDAIQYVHDRTVYCMNRGFAPDQINVVLSEALSSDPALAEFYGAIDWGVRAVYQFYYGWFDARPKNMQPLSNAERGARLVIALGGPDTALKHAAEALSERTPAGFKWALELCDALREYYAQFMLQMPRRDKILEVVRDIEAAALTKLGQSQINANARNFYLSSARAIRGGDEPPQTAAQTLSILYEANANMFLEGLPMHLNLRRAEALGERTSELTVLMHLCETPDLVMGDVCETWLLRVRGLHGVLQVDRISSRSDGVARADVTLWADETHAKAIILRPEDLERQADAGEIVLEPPGPQGRAVMALFLSLFDF